jgi:hypothetical protein
MGQINAASVLLLIRDGKAMDLDALAAMLAVDRPAVYARFDVNNALKELSEAGLVELGVPSASQHFEYGIGNVAVSLAPNWHLIQRSLGFSLTKLANRRDDTLEINPYFGPPTEIKPAPDVFVLMPFDPKMRPIYDDHILNVARGLKLVALRADDFFTTGHVMSDVWRAIYYTRLVIADCTERNPNVFYEIGVAHTLGRPVVLITQNAQDVPFDLRHIRFIQYVAWSNSRLGSHPL